MVTAENLFETTRSYLTPDSISQFSTVLNEPNEKVERTINAVVPTLIEGLISEGSTAEGAQKIVDLIEHDTSKGKHVVEDIFGHNYENIISNLGPSSGLNTHSVEKLIGMVAPMIIGVLETKIKDEGMNARKLRGFLKAQQSLTHFNSKKKPSLAVVLSFVFIAMLGIFSFITSQTTLPVTRMVRELASIESSVTPATKTSARLWNLKDLPEFMKSTSNPDLPKSFRLTNVKFALGTTDFTLGGDQDLDLIANSLKRFPGSTAIIQAYSEETGDEDENLLLSENRAMLIREEIIGRGVEQSRVKAEGLGARSEEDQAYFVLTKIK